jgi:AcrR family transcriptional regulator
MSRTPWGDASDLRTRMLRPGPRLSPELVAQNQRERLLAATAVAVAERGYEQTPVAELLKLSGISRTTFYQHFPGGKEECFLATVDAGMALALDAASGACEGEGDFDEHLGRAFTALGETIAEHPAAARLCLIDAYSPGEQGLAHVDEALSRFSWLLTRALGQSSERAAVPPNVVNGIVGGVREVLGARVGAGQADRAPALAGELLRWALSYRNPPTPLRRPRSRPPDDGASRFIVHDQVERIFGAVAATVVEKGYPAMTLEDIVKNASASLTTFYRHFDGKEDAFLAAYDATMAQAEAAAMPPFRWSRSWPLAVRAALEAFLAFFASEPVWARIAMVDALSAGPRALEHRARTLHLLDEIIQPGFEQAPDVPPIAGEAIGGAIYALIYEQIRRRGAEHLAQILPAVTYVALAPFVGAGEAVAVANKGALRSHGQGGRGNGSPTPKGIPRRRRDT